MTTLKKTAALGASALVALGGVGATFVAATTASAQQPDDVTAVSHVVSAETAIVRPAQVQGSFSFTQTEVATNDDLGRLIGEASKYLCNAQAMAVNEDASADEWMFSVRGAVKNPEIMSLAEFRDSGYAKTLVMGCSCMGNPVDGRASANAQITGIPLVDLLEVVEPEERANTIVFTSADGYEVALPLTYVVQRNAAMVFAVNDSPLVESVGGVNQLWLGSTPASYFARDIVAIEVQERQTPPPSPASEEARAELATLPNIGVLYGGEVR
ncbi:molybdopterin-dependent oxidoreductase [Adlercreutzia sp. R25]|uniref:molybdopterin-dependent oxidoreductase n=1 Tax=Adlercreutzia shanghongiae TaxID=3111773 RepID=UPI002DB5DF10|nr:molybdopterin-dependent oxidoreductase [Adlercreutzia sp. R25]MEC4273694.1 molybdopterin-dependent oxidoreductase [Adlercreutzia sp. R25]